MKLELKLILLFTLLSPGLLYGCSQADNLPGSPTVQLSPTAIIIKTLSTTVQAIKTPSSTSVPIKNRIEIVLETPAYIITQDEAGFDVIEIEGFSPSGALGEVMLPSKSVHIALPPNAELDSIKLEVIEAQVILLPDTYKFRNVPQPHPSTGKESTEQPSIQLSNQEVDLENFVRQFSSGQMRKWRFVRLEFMPFEYDLESGELRMAKMLKLQISYKLSTEPVDEAVLRDNIFDDDAQELFINYDNAKDWYNITSDN